MSPQRCQAPPLSSDGAGAAPLTLAAPTFRYIEAPMIIHRRKFDIRQWVLVTGFNPLTIWFFSDCYLRFCVEEYSLSDLDDSFAHLANNSISKTSDKFGDAQNGIGDGYMWSSDQFKEHLTKITGDPKVWERQIQPMIKRIVVWSLQSAQDMVDQRKNSFELYGYDFMIDEQLNPWLIEINSSPDCSYSTPCTEEVVKEALPGIVKVVVDYDACNMHKWGPKKRKETHARCDTGKWELVHHSRSAVTVSSRSGGHRSAVLAARRRAPRPVPTNRPHHAQRPVSGLAAELEVKGTEHPECRRKRRYR